MAQGITLISGSPLIGCPIVYRVTPASYNPNRTFHRIIVRVYAGLWTAIDDEQLSDEDFTTFDFSTPVETKPSGASYATQPALFDISSALQAVADKYEYEATPPTRYPYIKFRVEAWDEWMVDGNISTEQGKVYWPGDPVTVSGVVRDFFSYAFMGSFTDLERMQAGVDQGGVEYLNITYLSRKPITSPEVIYQSESDPYIYPAPFNRGLESDHLDSDTGEFVSGTPTDGPASNTFAPVVLGPHTVNGHPVYVIEWPENAYILRFINGMGCMESLHVESLVKREVPITTDKHTVAKQETLKKFSRSIVRKSNDRETWYLTSGPLDREWTSWYIHEFLMSEQIWLQLGTLWIPCHVVPEETTVLEDLTKAQPYEVQFKLEMDINGAPM